MAKRCGNTRFRAVLINCGRESNQAFARFIASSQESMTLVPRRTTLSLLAALSLIFTASHSSAGLGWTLAQFRQQYGKPILDQEQIAGRVGYVFTRKDYIIVVFVLHRKVSRIMYVCRNGSVFNWGTARALLGANAPEAIWADASRNEADNTYRVNGTKDGVETYYALLTEDGKMLVIWTKEDDETGRTSPKPDTSPIFSAMGSNERTTSEKIVGQASSVERELTPKVSQPDVQTDAASSSSAERPESARVMHTKMRRVRSRSSMPHRHFDAKTRLIALWHQSLRHEKSRGVTRFSHSNDTIKFHRHTLLFWRIITGIRIDQVRGDSGTPWA
jgi:hypothetical protein